MVVFGGCRSTAEFVSDMYVYDPATSTWTSISLRGAPIRGRAWHCAVLVRGKYLVVIGGARTNRYLHLPIDVVDMETAFVHPCTTLSVPSSGLSAVEVDDDIVVIGSSHLIVINTNSLLQAALSSSTELAGVNCQRTSHLDVNLHTAVYSPPLRRIFIFGGTNSEGTRTNSVLTVNPDAYDDIPMDLSQRVVGDVPAPRSFHAACLVPGDATKMLVNGGFYGCEEWRSTKRTETGCFAGVYVLDLANLRWWRPVVLTSGVGSMPAAPPPALGQRSRVEEDEPFLIDQDETETPKPVADPSLPPPRCNFTMVQIAGMLLALGGVDGGPRALETPMDNFGYFDVSNISLRELCLEIVGRNLEAYSPLLGSLPLEVQRLVEVFSREPAL
eukprot:TRINITY_DN53793_c0_g1_i1.p1 TRINITY_DN53793_c0_g1~~TRINITY_DN53793_c0_g1_i1.p1  ORF type:complete len:436 (+),score=61.77 TRINITY_DN53793_c0_g1_i1:151-1308(+)